VDATPQATARSQVKRKCHGNSKAAVEGRGQITPVVGRLNVLKRTATNNGVDMDFTTKLAEIHVVGTEDSAIEPLNDSEVGSL
jgi:hypothetical protein